MNENNIFNQSFATKEELITALEDSIVEKDGSFSVGGVLRATFEEASKNAGESQKYRQRAQRAESELATAKNERDDLQTRLEAVLELKPEETQKRLQEYATEKASLEKQLKELPALKDRVLKYEQAEKTAKIREELRRVATSLNVRTEALRDVERLSSAFTIDAIDGTIKTADGKDVASVLADELKLSPHWLQPSQSGGAQGSSGIESTGDAARAQAYEKARKDGDVEGMIRNAPPKS